MKLNFKINAALGIAVLAMFCVGRGAIAPRTVAAQPGPNSAYRTKVDDEDADLANQMMQLDPFDDGSCQDAAALDVLSAALEERP